jgi:hypothetical protein
MTDPANLFSPRKLLLLLGLPTSLATWAWLEARAADSAESSHSALVRQVEQMSEDASVIEALARAPKRASERERANDELVAQIRDALGAAGIAMDRWITHDPVPVKRAPDAKYKELSVRLVLEAVSLRQFVEFAFHLTERDRTLRLPHVRLSSPQGIERGLWNVDVNVSYLVYAPPGDGA